MEKRYTDAQSLLKGLFGFLDKSVSPFHSAAAACEMLEQEGYTLCPEGQPWKLEQGGRYYTTRNGTAVLAWRMPQGRLTGWHVTASHGDSPTWRIKVPDIGEGGYLKAETEGYGGMIVPTWLDRPLSVAGRLLVKTADGVETRLVAPDRALLCIPNVCIHFDREANTGKNWNYQVDLQPICGLEGGTRLMDILAAEAGVSAGDILAHDLVLCTRQKAERVGVDGELFMSGRIDDLECAYTTLCGFLAGEGKEAGRADVWCMFDNEEVGSSSRQGAQGTMMADTPQALARAKVITVATRKITKGSSCPPMRGATLSMMNWSMPRDSQADLNMKAMTSRASTDTMVEKPSQTPSTYSAMDISRRAR